jgi:trehalose-phosphatase
VKHLTLKLDELTNRLKEKHIFLFLDYDGTLAPITKTPAKAVIPQKIKYLLGRLSQSRRCTVVIITGRSLKDIKNKVGIPGIIYSGNHGLQISGHNISFEAPIPPNYKTILRKIKKELHKKLHTIKGALLEDKGLTLSLHYRIVNKQKKLHLKKIFYDTAASCLKSDKIKIQIGKKVLEIQPPIQWNKGKAVLWLLKHRLFMRYKFVVPVYLGDDKTDEDAFKILKKKGLTVFIGKPKKSYANFFLKNTQETCDFLDYLNNLLL